MPLDSFANLKAAFVDELLASELTVAQQDDIVVRAEDRIQLDLELSQGETRATATLDKGESRLALPVDYIETRTMRLVTNPVGRLDFISPKQMDEIWAGSTSGPPKAYTVEADEFRFAPAADIAYTVEQIYEAGFVALSDANPSNFILTNYPTLYLNACLAEAASFTQDDALTTKYEALYGNIKNRVELRDWKRRAAGSALQIRHDYGVT